MKKYIVSIVLFLSIAVGAPVLVAHAQTSPLNLTHTLMGGSRGDDVALLQGFLLNKGLFNFPSPTRYFGPITKDAVIAFQKAYAIDPVGIAGPITRAKILELTSQKDISASTLGVGATVNLLGATQHRGSHRSSSRQNIVDEDGDGIADTADNCPNTSNEDQIDEDADGVGDSCDNCPAIFNAGQADDDNDGIGNACEDEEPPPAEAFLLTVAKAGTGLGTVTDDPVIDCGVTCSHSYDSGTVVTLTASASDGSHFVGWSGGGCSGTGMCTVTLSNDTFVTATFDFDRYILTVNQAGSASGQVTSSPFGINCGMVCAAYFYSDATVTLTATPNSGTHFVGWFGSGCSGTGACIITMTNSLAVTALFDMDGGS
ncbi:MAG: peptidoglycan-binding protein [bacterium]